MTNHSSLANSARSQRRTANGLNRYLRLSRNSEAGQATILLAGVVAVVLLLAVAITLIGDAMIQRGRARTAADTVALGAARSVDDARELQSWYATRGVRVNVSEQPDRVTAHASSGPSQAKAWAGVAEEAVEVSPALRAIVARVEQLRGVNLAPMRSMQAEFLLCSSPVEGASWRFESC